MEVFYDAVDAFSSTNTQSLSACDICGRNFNSDALARHIPICQKNAQKKRKVFDASKQRADGTDIKIVKNKSKPGRPPPNQGIQKPKTNNWRAKHEDFVNTIRAARGVQACIDSGRPLPPPPPPTINPDYIQCPHCSRRFNQTAAERHINFCKETHNRLPAKKPSAAAASKQQIRTQYKAPRPGQKQSPTALSAGGSTGMNGTVRGSGYGGAGGMYQKTPPGSSGSRGKIDYNNSPSPSGRALRTGRTAETYSEARELSAKQRSNMPPKNAYSSKPKPSYGVASPGGQYDSANGDSFQTPMTISQAKRAGSGAAKFCHECGTKYPVPHAKFCCECGLKRVNIAG